eukprot:11222373-Lingulodinium_polyedra.AAC.1
MLPNDALKSTIRVRSGSQSDVRAFHARSSFCCTHKVRERAIRGGRPVEVVCVLFFGCCLRA